MGQSKLHSLIESFANILIGFSVAMASQMIIFPVFGINIETSEHFLIGGFFTIVSICRSYCVRRLFNWYHITYKIEGHK